jgi:hypothetical protein
MLEQTAIEMSAAIPASDTSDNAPLLKNAAAPANHPGPVKNLHPQAISKSRPQKQNPHHQRNKRRHHNQP